jgi:hypothetical protein
VPSARPGQRQPVADREAAGHHSAGDAPHRRHQRKHADDRRCDRRRQSALDQIRRLVQADPGLHRKDQRRIEQDEPEGRGLQRLAAREGRLGGKQTFIRRAPLACFLRSIRRETEILGPAHQQQPGRDKADQQCRRADREPARAPTLLQYRELRQKRHRDKPGLLRQGRDRCREGAASHKPVRQCAVDAEIERPRPVHPRQTEQQIELQKRSGRGQQQERDPIDEHGGAEHQPRAAPVEQRPDQRRGDRRQDAA